MIGIERFWCAYVHDLKGPITFNKYQQILVTAIDYNIKEIVLTAGILCQLFVAHSLTINIGYH